MRFWKLPQCMEAREKKPGAAFERCFVAEACFVVRGLENLKVTTDLSKVFASFRKHLSSRLVLLCSQRWPGCFGNAPPLLHRGLWGPFPEPSEG